jgi:hypothetical protein
VNLPSISTEQCELIVAATIAAARHMACIHLELMRDATDNTHQSVMKRNVLLSRIEKWAKGPVFASVARGEENIRQDVVTSNEHAAAGSVLVVPVSDTSEELATTSTAIADKYVEGVTTANDERDESEVTLDERIEAAIEQGICEKIRPLTERIRKPGNQKSRN